jgi:diaminohydroxyphosphoribosylaminopyrimidine deaminase/5-amino-6-(5-phosphoribosylamino)uracil reductase
MTDTASDLRFMELALALGRRGRGNTWPNPAVGAVIVKDGVIVGRGWTQSGGRPHAEPVALSRAGAAARGATLYATLEPCSHHGKSPPCADAIIAAGISRVVSAIEDPNPEVAGKGHARLRAADIRVDVGLCKTEAAHDHAGHFLRVREGRPHVTLKLAVSADGKIAASGRKQIAITGEAARARVHLLRAQSDAIMVGIGTVLADDPRLTCRLPGLEVQSPIRMVLDSDLRVPLESQLVASAHAHPLWIVTSEAENADRSSKLESAGTKILRLPVTSGATGLDPATVLNAISERGITRLMIEGGAMVASSFLAARLVDDIWLLQAPMDIGPDGLDALGPQPLTSITQSAQWRERASERLGSDTLTIFERR